MLRRHINSHAILKRNVILGDYQALTLLLSHLLDLIRSTGVRNRKLLKYCKLT